MYLTKLLIRFTQPTVILYNYIIITADPIVIIIVILICHVIAVARLVVFDYTYFIYI